MRRHLDVTTYTTFDHLDACVEGDGWIGETVAILDVESPRDGQTVTLGLEHDPGTLERLEHHADYALLTPGQARTLADELEAAAAAADRGDALTSGRR